MTVAKTKKTKAKKTKQMTPVQLYGYRILWNLLQNNLGKIAGYKHNLWNPANKSGSTRWYLEIHLTKMPKTLRTTWHQADYKVLEVDLMPSGADISLIVGRTVDENVLYDTITVDYETLFESLPAILKEMTGLEYPTKDEDPPVSTL
jgi:hypothetical protein